MTDTVFIHTNAKQMIGALVSAHSLKRNSANPDRFEVKILQREDYGFFDAKEGQEFLRGGGKRVWRNDDLQSFTPLRFMPPEAMGYTGRAVVIDPDIFAAGDIVELLSMDMDGKAIMCVPRPGHNDSVDYLATSVMLMDCAKLTHWRCEEQFNEMFAFKRDYVQWIELALEPRETLGLLDPVWNSFDRLEPETRLLHNTKRKTQPWKTGLPVDFTVREKSKPFSPKGWLKRLRSSFGGEAAKGRYQPHPDPRQETFFFDLLKECVDQGSITEDMIQDAMSKDYVRHDALEMIRGERKAA
ncbi:MAG: hypothetical protein R3F54_09905 [Alphaproteobacteria bacterium]